MGRRLRWALGALVIAGCAPAAPGVQQRGAVDAGGGSDAGEVAQSVVPPSVSFETARGGLTGPEAFPVESAQTELQDPVDGGASYVGFQLSDAAQCPRADLDGGSPDPGPVTHVVNGYVRRFDGAPVSPGSYAIGMSSDSTVQGYLVETEFDRDGGSSRTLLATSGQLTLGPLTGGHLEGSFDVQLGDPANQLELPLSGHFASDTCTAP